MIDIKVIDNFLTKQEHAEIYKELNGETGLFPWFYSDCVNHNNDPKEQFQFCHQFYDMIPNSQYFHLVKPLINKLDMTAIAKIKANLLLKTKIPVVFGYHSDYNWKHKWWTAIYYVNSNNGKTIFKESKKNVVSKENRLVLFDGRLEHCGTTSTNSKKRIVINLNFFNKEMGK
tara:strand:+ start:79 stop:597 length:519 start_codon:yes stop_codon:yes gene_type:complete